MSLDPQLLELLAQMDGSVLPNYCEHCDADAEVVSKGRGVILMKTNHARWCPNLGLNMADQ